MTENRLEKLKAKAYDLLAIREKATQELSTINQMIAQESKNLQKNEETKKEDVKKQ